MHSNVRMVLLLVAAIILLLPLSAGPSLAKELSAKEIIDKSQDKQFPENSVADVTMILINKSGQQRERKILTKRRDFGNGEAKSVAYFLSPADVKGTAFLVWEHKDQNNDLFIYLPALKKIRRIASDQKHQSFMGSDFSYSDMEDRDVEEADHKIIREERMGDQDCWVIESIPKESSDSQYGRLVSWVRKQDFIPQKIEFYDKNKELIKLLDVKRIGPVGDTVLPLHFLMEDVQKKHKTEFILDTIELNQDIPDSEFTQQRIQR